MTVSTLSSRSLPGANETCPPSVGSAVQPILPGTRADTPSPVPAPRTPTARPGAAVPPPICSSSVRASCGIASAWATKSLITARSRTPNRALSPEMEKRHGLLVKPISSVSTGVATAITASDTRLAPR